MPSLLDICEFISLLIIFFSLEGRLRVKFSGPNCLGEAVNLQPGLDAFLKRSIFFCHARG